LPHALESLLSILVVIRQESVYDASTSSSLSLRQSYATVIIRLVNGLVDPLQLGAYARSISSIAAQINLPAWLVELRHAATHEDLPSLELLRDGAKEVSGTAFAPWNTPQRTQHGPSVSQLAPAQLFPSHTKPGPRARITTSPATASPPPRGTSAQAVQEPAEEVARAQRRRDVAARGGRSRCAARDRALARRGTCSCGGGGGSSDDERVW
jgi:ribosomal biogenesis protein LAS1